MDQKDIFKLTGGQLKDVAFAFRDRIEEGLAEENSELLALPAFITPNTGGVSGKVLVLDLGGTNYRVAVADFSGKDYTLRPENGWKKDLSVMKTSGFSEAELMKEMGDPIDAININEEMPIGYCFSYPCQSLPDGDAKLLVWTKGINIDEMVGQTVGKRLMDYLNETNNGKFTRIKVINDTVASLFAGLTKPGYDAYIGLIVGTGTNMAPFIEAARIPKLGGKYDGMLPVNLESGNFRPPHLTEYDDMVDANSDKPGNQRFEKAISGFYLGELLKAVFPKSDFEAGFNAERLNAIMNYPDVYKDEYVSTARAIYRRSAELVAASIAGQILVLKSHDSALRRIMITAEGGLFWSKDCLGTDYNRIVTRKLYALLEDLGVKDVNVDLNEMDNANLIGTAIAALS